MKRALLIATGYRVEVEPFIHYRPTPLIKIVDKPIIFHVLEYLIKQGICHFDIVLHQLPEKIESLLGEGKRWGIDLVYHLARDPRFPFAPIKPLAESWGSEKIVLGQGDSLPKFAPHSFQGREEGPPLLFTYPTKEWTGWGLVAASLFSKISAETTEENFPSQINTSWKTDKAFPFLSTHTFHDIMHSNFRFISQSHSSLFPSNAHLVEPGVWIGHAVSTYPGIKVVPPIYIGENSQIKANVQLGPDVIIESNCIIDEGSVIQHSIICQKSYVGEALNIANSLVDRNLLINLSHHTVVHIHDDFILSGLTSTPFRDCLLNWLERFFALMLIALLSPFYFIMKLSCKSMTTEMIALPSDEDQSQWKTFGWRYFVPKQGPASRFQSIFHRLPVLFNIARGQVHFIGVSPRTKKETAQLPHDWQRLYLKSKVGLITLADLNSLSFSNPDDIYAAEAYYATHMNFHFDLLLLMRWLKKKLSTVALFRRQT